MACADSITVSLEEWSPPCRMCGQLQLVLPDRPHPNTRTEIGSLCFDCFTEFVSVKLRTSAAWDVQYTALMTALTENLPTSTARRIANILAAAHLNEGQEALASLPARRGPGV